MRQVKLEQSFYMGYPYVKVEGDLTVDTFAAFHTMVKGATKFGTIPVIADFSGELNIANDVKEIRCWRTPANIPEFARDVDLVIIGTPEIMEEIRALLTPHDLLLAFSLENAVELLEKRSKESPAM